MMMTTVPAAAAVISTSDTLRTHVYYTLVAHANQGGVCAGLSLQDIGDVAGWAVVFGIIGSRTNASTQRAIGELEREGKVRVDQLNRRHRTFFLLTVTPQERADARAFVMRAQPRVAELRAKRAEVRNVVGLQTESLTIPGVTVEFSAIKMTHKEDRRRYRCDVTLVNIGTVRNCSIVEYANRLAVYGPGRPIDAEKTQFRDWVVFDAYLQQIIVRAFAERLERNELVFIE